MWMKEPLPLCFCVMTVGRLPFCQNTLIIGKNQHRSTHTKIKVWPVHAEWAKFPCMAAQRLWFCSSLWGVAEEISASRI